MGDFDNITFGMQRGGDYVKYTVFGPRNGLGLFNRKSFTIAARGVDDFLDQWKKTDPISGKYIVVSNFNNGVAREYEIVNETRIEMVKS